jgi:hypothetical protein
MNVINRYKTAVFIVVAVLMAGLWSCEEDIRRTTFGNLAYFVAGNQSKSVKSNDPVILVPITHRNHNLSGKAKLSLSPAEGNPAGLCSLVSEEVNFGNGTDTVMVEISINFDQLADDGFYNYVLEIAEGEAGYLEPMQFDDAFPSTTISFSKYIPLDRAPFLGAFTEYDGYDYYDVTIEEDPDDEFGLIINGGNWGPSGKYKVIFNTNMQITIVHEQFINVTYPGEPSPDGDVYYLPASDGSYGSYDTATGAFTVVVNMYLPYYDYSFGDYELEYVKK